MKAWASLVWIFISPQFCVAADVFLCTNENGFSQYKNTGVTAGCKKVDIPGLSPDKIGTPETNLWADQNAGKSASRKIIILNCSIGFPNGSPLERAISIDYADRTVDGIKAEINENEIRWSYENRGGSTTIATLNRLSGFIDMHSQEGGFGSGRCAPATKKF